MADMIPERTIVIVAALFEVDQDSLLLDTRFREDLGADELTMAELILALEEQFGVDIPDGEGERLRTIRDAILLIERLLGH